MGILLAAIVRLVGCHGWSLSWYANPLYMLAFIFRRSKPTVSIFLELASLLLASSFLLYRTIIADEGGSSQAIVTYGWGYFLWILAFAVLFFGDLYEYLIERKIFAGFSGSFPVFIVTVLISTLFLSHYYLGHNSQFQIERRRDKVFQEKCKLAGEEIYRRSEAPVKGLYFKPNYGVRYGNINKGKYSSLMHGNEGDRMLMRHLLEFYETENNDKKTYNANIKPYRRFYPENHNGIEIDKLESDYSVITKFLDADIEEELSITGAEITIIDNKTQLVMAKTTYFSTRFTSDHKFCGCSVEGKFSNEDFLRRVLNIAPRSN